MVFAGAWLTTKDKAGDVAVELVHILTRQVQGVHLPLGFHFVIIEGTVLMEWTYTGAVKRSLHFHRAVFAGQCRSADLTLFFLPCQELFAGGKGGLYIGWHHFLQTLH
ncbi:hypothetical protein D3C80_1450980 [compost metagenome]